MYISATDPNVDSRPCIMCRRMIINAGISEVVARIDGVMYRSLVSDWLHCVPDLFMEAAWIKGIWRTVDV